MSFVRWQIQYKKQEPNSAFWIPLQNFYLSSIQYQEKNLSSLLHTYACASDKLIKPKIDIFKREP